MNKSISLLGALGLILATKNASAFIYENDYHDPSNNVLVHVRGCDPTALSHAPSGSCGVPAGYVLVGGGASVVNNREPGALLTSSYPDTDPMTGHCALTTWHGSSKDHGAGQSFPHQLVVWSIGLQLRGMSEQDLRFNMNCTYHPYQYNGVGTGVPPAFPSPRPLTGMTLMGGGVRTNPSGPGLILVRSAAGTTGEDNRLWYGIVKHIQTPDTGTFDVFQISIGLSDLPNPYNALTIQKPVFGSGPEQCDPWCSETYTNTDPNKLLIGLGAIAQYSGAGRYLTKLSPLHNGYGVQDGVQSQSKDHLSGDAFLNDPSAIQYTFGMLLNTR